MSAERKRRPKSDKSFLYFTLPLSLALLAFQDFCAARILIGSTISEPHLKLASDVNLSVCLSVLVLRQLITQVASVMLQIGALGATCCRWRVVCVRNEGKNGWAEMGERCACAGQPRRRRLLLATPIDANDKQGEKVALHSLSLAASQSRQNMPTNAGAQLHLPQAASGNQRAS